MIDLAPIAFARGVHFIALAGLVGAPLFRWRIVAVPWRVDDAALALAIASAVAWMLCVAADVGEGVRDAIDPHHVYAVVAHTGFGHVWSARVLGLLGLVAMRWARPDAWQLHLLIAALVTAGLALHGHGTQAPPAWAEQGGRVIHGVADAVHALAGLGWIGALVMLLRVLRSGPPTVDAVDQLRRFSRLGLALVGALVTSGAINAFFVLGEAQTLAGSDYATVLGFKIALAFGMIGLAGANRCLLMPRIAAGVPWARDALSMLVCAELALGAVLLGGTALLGVLHPAH